MTKPMFEIITGITEDELWEEISFKLNAPQNPSTSPSINFAPPFTTRLILGEYVFGNLTIQLSLTRLYEEKDQSIALSYCSDDERIDSHGVLRNESSTGIPTDRYGNAIMLSHRLPQDFYNWLEHMQRTIPG